MATIKVQTKTPGNLLNVRKGMSGKAHAEITGTLKDGTVVENAELSKNGKFYKVEGGYVLAELCVAIDGEDPEADDVEYDEA